MNTKTIRTALKLSIIAAMAAFCMLDAGTAKAGSATANLSVSASVSANCTISTSALSFSAYDPVSANGGSGSDLTGTGGVTVACTSGAGATITLDQGGSPAGGSSNAAPARQMSDGGSNMLAYSLYQDSGQTTVWGNTVGTGAGHSGDGASHAITIYGKIAKGQNVPSGSYSDTVVATVSF